VQLSNYDLLVYRLHFASRPFDAEFAHHSQGVAPFTGVVCDVQVVKQGWAGCRGECAAAKLLRESLKRELPL
jgi:hypothetical protein